MKCRLAWATCLHLLLLFTVAAAQTPPADYEVEAPPEQWSASVPRGKLTAAKREHLHDRMFWQFAIGPGWFGASNDSENDQRRFSGTSLSFQALLAGTPEPGFIIGGGYLRDQIFGMTVKDDQVDGDEPDLSDTEFALDQFVLMMGGYPDPRAGLSFQVHLGYAVLNTRRPNVENPDDPYGLVLGLNGGYDWWVGPQSSLGLKARLSVARLAIDDAGAVDQSLLAILPSIFATYTYH